MDQKLRCLVCDDEISVGKHYGSVCCSGCKSFFRRSIYRRMQYVCPENNACPVTRQYRNRCRACRLRRCYEVGLDARLVRDCHTTLGPSGEGSRDDYQSPDSTSTISTSAVEMTPASSTTEELGMPMLSTEIVPAGSTTMDNDLCRRLVAEMREAEARYHDNAIIMASGRRAFEARSQYTLGNYSGLLNNLVSNTLGSSSMSRYFILVERFCENFQDSHPTQASNAFQQPDFDINIPVERAFTEPGALCARTRLDWSAQHVMDAESMPRQWCRMAGFYADWASHIPELRQLDGEDALRLLIARNVQCVWFWFADRSIAAALRSRQQQPASSSTIQPLVLFGGGSYFPLDAVSNSLHPSTPHQGTAAHSPSIDPSIVSYLQPICRQLFEEIIQHGVEMGVTEEEMALLKVLTFCVPVQTLTPQGKNIIQSAQLRYQSALVTEVMSGVGQLGSATGYQDRTVPELSSRMQRLGRLFGWLAGLERIAEAADNQLSLMTLFNVAQMSGSLPYEIHVRRGT